MDENKTFLQQAENGDLDPLQAVIYTAKSISNLPPELPADIKKRIINLVAPDMRKMLTLAERARGIKVVPDFNE